MASYPIGTIINKHKTLFDPIVFHVASNTEITGGKLVYQDGANGLKTVTTAKAATLDASEILFPQFDTSNNPGAQGNKRVECYKSGIRGIIEGTGSIPVNKYVKASDSKAGCVELWVKGNDDPALILGIYRGHDSEVTGINNPCTSSTDGETNLVVDFK